MKRPTSEIVSGLEYQIHWKEQVIGEDMSVIYGQCRSAELKICVSTNYPVARQRETLLHETLHAIEAECLAEQMTESAVKLVARGLFNWMRSNRSVVKWIME